jgi:hypothetical protein
MLGNTSISVMRGIRPFAILPLFYYGGKEMSVLICSACLDKIVSNCMKGSCIIWISLCSCVLFAEIFVFQYYFRLLGRMSFSVILQFSGVKQGFRSLVSVYLYNEYLLSVEVKEITFV